MVVLIVRCVHHARPASHRGASRESRPSGAKYGGACNRVIKCGPGIMKTRIAINVRGRALTPSWRKPPQDLIRPSAAHGFRRRFMVVSTFLTIHAGCNLLNVLVISSNSVLVGDHGEPSQLSGCRFRRRYGCNLDARRHLRAAGDWISHHGAEPGHPRVGGSLVALDGRGFGLSQRSGQDGLGFSGQARLSRFDQPRRRPDLSGGARSLRLRRRPWRAEVSVNLAKGIFRFTTGGLDKKAYTIDTPTAAIGVRGTVLDIDVRSAQTRVTLVEGRAFICPRKAGVTLEQQVRACATGVGRCDCEVIDHPGQTALVKKVGGTNQAGPTSNPVNFASLCSGAASLCSSDSSYASNALGGGGGALCGR